MPRRTRANVRTGVILAAVALSMVGAAFAAVPLYRLFCQVTGYGGTPQRAEAAPTEVLDRRVTVRFNADVAADLPWGFRAAQGPIALRVGEEALAYYEATNESDETIIGQATFNVTPDKVGLYFNKIECFCFTEQTLKPGETARMAVSFFVDPAIAADVNLDDVGTITLSYTFFRVPGEEPLGNAAASAAPQEPGS
ncbi:MAG: cytochrome c oxidase assembly protein [Alphaproteobacteria bacterium]|nr:cytochrome c oxidase assembly protein [Alphaproteobacteria bacterium]